MPGLGPEREELQELLHELRAPLAGLVAIAEMLEEPLRSEQVNLVNHLQGVMERACREMSPALETLELFEHAEQTACMVRSGSPVHRVETVGDHIEVTADRVHLRQIILNLLVNALRHSPAGGLIQLVVTEHNGQGSITVRDQGPGIDPSLQESVFLPGVTGGDRSGIGLAVSRRLAEGMGGKLRALPSEHGAAIRLTLPAADRKSRGTRRRTTRQNPPYDQG